MIGFTLAEGSRADQLIARTEIIIQISRPGIRWKISSIHREFLLKMMTEFWRQTRAGCTAI